MTRALDAARPVAWARARTRAFECAAPGGSERVPLPLAVGRVLAEPLRALTSLPAFDTAAMDGYAAAGQGPWRLVCPVGARAGHPWDGRLVEGEAVPVATGAVVPAGACGVLPFEVCRLLGDWLTVSAAPHKPHIRSTGEDVLAGATVLPAGTRVRCTAVGLAASLGHDMLLVRRRPTIAAMVTGDEIRSRGVPSTGQVRDAIGPMLPSLVAGFGGCYLGMSATGDDFDLSAMPVADVVVVTGSTSVGVTDRLRALLGPATLVVDGVACRPGHPMLLGRLEDGRWVVGLPGSPFAAYVAAHTLLGPLLLGLSGAPLPVLPRVRLDTPLATDLTRVVPVRWTSSGSLAVVPGGGAAFLGGAATADGLAVLGPGCSRATFLAV